MGSPGSGAADCTVGSIVWVRRRNGSWWPGKILGQEDLDSTHITSPRSGTPVKLLGREDASVDWYNLEKSKRVKPFRCGDFDDCIDRVESTQGLTIRKREKYARREDAILHALELEKEMLKKEGKLVPEKPTDNSPDAAKERMVIARVQDISNGTRESTDSLGFNHVGDVVHLLKDKEDDLPSCENEVVPRMRGLQDFGLRTASSKRKFSSSNGPDTSLKSLARSNSSASSSGDHSMERPSYTLGKENSRSTMEAKRTRYMTTPNESNNVLDLHESFRSHRAAMHSSFAGGDSRYTLSEYDPPEFLEDNESDSSESETDSSDMEDTDDDIPLLSGSGRHPERHNNFSRHMSAEDESTSSEEDCYESSISGDSSYLYSQDPDNEAGTVSKWQLKGKRNMRNLPRRSARRREMHRNRLEDGRYCEYKRRAFGQKPMGYGLDSNGTNDTSDGTDDTNPNERQFGDRMFGPGDDDYQLSTMVASGYKNIYSHDMLDWEDDPWEGPTGVKKRWEEKLEGLGQEFDASHRHFGRKMYSPLMDVDLEVRGSYQKGPVPIVSLMSKLNGRAIIGHPVEIEVLADGSSESYFGNETTYHDKPFLLPPAWKTARRSNSRVPRLHPFSSSLEADDEDHSPVDQGRRPPFKKLGLGNLSSDDNSVRRSNPMRIPRPPGKQQQQQKKLLKNTNASPSQKTRPLSSFSGEQGHNGMKALRDRTHELSNRRVLPGPPTVACIPVKLVFSRLLEKINRPPSKPTAKAFNERRRDQ
uniref:PWWP domain-containing protein n=1 Tax=Noccaea caerulescens TaxID=107243 RepID=A0A1J3DRI5_NOCCA